LRYTLALAAVAMIVGCGDGSRVELVLHVPAGDRPLQAADEVALTVRDGGGNVVAFARAAAADPALSAGPLPPGDGYVAELEARYGPDVVARGRSCAFTVGATAPRVELWFSRVGRFAPTAAPGTERQGAVALGWLGGALWAGGAANGAALATSERYDPASGTFQAGPTLATARAGAAAIMLDSDTALLAGGAAPGSAGLEALFPSHTTPEPSPFAPGLTDAAMVRLGDDTVLLAGGHPPGAAAVADAWHLTEAGAVVSQLSPMTRPRARFAMTRLGNDRFAAVLLVGGEDAAGPLADLELYDPATSSFAPFPAHLATARSGATSTLLPSGLVLVVGGVDAAGRALATAEIVDPVTRSVRSGGALAVPRAGHSATSLPSGRVLIAGGSDDSGSATDSAEIFDPALGAEGDFVPTASLTTPRAQPALVPLCDGTFLVLGGAPGAEIYNPF
jgi:hypothetical protein